MSNEIEIKNAKIVKAEIEIHECRFLDCWLQFDYGGLMQSFGGYVLYFPSGHARHRLETVAGHHIYRILQVSEATSWSDIIGKTIRVKCSWDKIYSIGHIIKDDWFSPSEDYSELNGKS